ncbi:MAG: ribosome maturation factor [Chitinophagaceae bacterium]|nr:ribosome maturation factor [Chitinophagaceae bacterium]
MANEIIIQTLRDLIEKQLAADPAFYLVELKITLTNNIKIFVDGDNGVTIEKCVSINRAIYKELEELAFFPDNDFSLEVSSPGLDEPIKMLRQYQKNKGRQIEVLLNDGVKIEGKLAEVEQDHIVVEEKKGKNKKSELVLHDLLFDNIKTTKIQVVF